jgi:integrase
VIGFGLRRISTAPFPTPRHIAQDHFWAASKKDRTGREDRLAVASPNLLFLAPKRLGVDVKVQQELMRHADIRTTLQLYTDAFSEDVREATEGPSGK